MNTLARLTALERERGAGPGPVLGWRMTMQNPAGDVLRESVMVCGQRPGMATEYLTPSGFAARYPDGVIYRSLVLVHDDDAPPAPHSLAAFFFGTMAAS